MQMIRLNSREYADASDFVKDFLKTLTPGIIPRVNFIKWSEIEQKMLKLSPFIDFYVDLKNRLLVGGEFVSELVDSFLACDSPLPYIKCAFEILGHTSSELVTKQDDVHLFKIAQEIKSGNESSALLISNILNEMGFENVLARDDLDDVLLGVQIGLETHRRKNIGGEQFKNEVNNLLYDIVEYVYSKTRKNVAILSEVKIPYGDGLSKRVDFAINIDGAIKLGIEVNFYTVPGSKPTEIKRSYGDIRRGLLSSGVDLIWITDGKGYRAMQRSLRDAYIIFPNIYNYKQAEKYLSNDLITLFQLD